MKRIIAIIFCALSLSVYAQNGPTVINDEKSNSQILIGNCKRADFIKVPFLQIFEKEYRSYVVNDTVLIKLQGKTEKITIKIILACWCDDSKVQVPRFYKITDDLKITENQIDIICVDRDKKAEGMDLTPLNFTLVPTFIIYRDGIEIGRIVETPQISLEKDLLKILEK